MIYSAWMVGSGTRRIRYRGLVQNCARVTGKPEVIRARSRLGGHYHPSGVFQPEFVVHCLAESLLAAKITFGGLNRCMSKQELNLLKFSARQMA